MMSWIAGLWAPEPAKGGLDALRREQRLLQELLACYREFGFDALVPDLSLRISRQARRIRHLEKRRSSSTV